MNIVLFLAALAFLVSAVWSSIQRAWPIALLALGAFIYTLHASGLIAT